MAADLDPPELARLLDHAERPREDGWSTRSALTRYAQPEPQRVGDLLDVVRWTDFALRPHAKRLAREGPAVWAALGAGGAGDPLVELLRVVQGLDAVGDVLAAWAVDPYRRPRPDAEVDAAIGTAVRRLQELGAPREERPARPPRGARSRG